MKKGGIASAVVRVNHFTYL